MKVAVIVFPGSNCDHDALHTYGRLMGQDAYSVWHRETTLGKPDLVVVPGGFAYGDYLRTGALAKVSPIMKDLRRHAERGTPILGICNGFQILCEAQILPGVLLQNIQMKFLSQFVNVKVESTKTVFTKGLEKGQIISCPIAHFEGNYFADTETLKRIEGEGQVVFRYCDAKGNVDPKNLESNPNGALNAIAGVTNEKGNVVGLMPHPERAAETLVGFVGADSGRAIFEASLSA